MSRSLTARNSAAVPSHRRGFTTVQKVRAAARDRWMEVGRVYARKHGEKKALALVSGLRRSESDFAYGCRFLWRIDPLVWQTTYETEGLDKHRLCIARLMNGGGKTTGYALTQLMRGFFRKGALPTWRLYRMFHFAPVEAQALETKVKIDEILKGLAREQIATIDGSIRPPFGARFVEEMGLNGHDGFSFFNGSATLEFAPTAFMGMAKDGTDPMYIALDEARHERNLTYLIDRIWLPRFLRAPESRLDIRYTPLDASPDLEYIKDRAQRGHRYWWAWVATGDLREINPTIRREDQEMVEGSVSDKHVLLQIIRGQDIQPPGAKFSLGAVKAMFTTLDEPEWLGQLEGLRARVEGRCPRCRSRQDGHPEDHMMVAALDPASSAVDGDSIVFEAWDIDGPNKPCEVVYLYEVERTGEKDGPETIQKVAEHFKALAREIRGPVGYDRKSALGHALKDHLVDLEEEGVEIVEVAWDTREAKIEDIDLVKALIEGAHLISPFHPKLNAQFRIYTQLNDKKIAQDFVMVTVVVARVAWPYLPDFVTDPAELAKVEQAQEEATPYDMGDNWGPHADFGFSGTMPDGYGTPSRDGLEMDSSPVRSQDGPTGLAAPSRRGAVGGLRPQRLDEVVRHGP
jgi:hypothetical protein